MCCLCLSLFFFWGWSSFHRPVESRGLRGPDTLVIGALADIQSWNPYLTETKFSEDLLALVYPSLMVEDVDYRQHPPSFRPALAQSWEFSPDHLSLDLHLNPQATWGDGEPMGADDVLFTWEVQRDPEVGWYASYTKDWISSVEAVDSHTIRVHFDHAYPYQLMDLNEEYSPKGSLDFVYPLPACKLPLQDRGGQCSE